jgi:hypothetical protein
MMKKFPSNDLKVVKLMYSYLNRRNLFEQSSKARLESPSGSDTVSTCSIGGFTIRAPRIAPKREDEFPSFLLQSDFEIPFYYRDGRQTALTSLMPRFSSYRAKKIVWASGNKWMLIHVGQECWI